MNILTLRAQRHAPPPGWGAETFERLTDALAAALVAAVRRRQAEEGEQDSDDKTGGGRA